MTKIIYVSDIHFKDKPPISRVDDYSQSLLEKLYKVSSLTEKLNADLVVLSGDVFDVKDGSKTSYGLWIKILSCFSSFNCPVYSIIGNHDIKYDRLDTIDQQPLGALFATGAVKHLNSLSIGNAQLIGVDFTPHNKTTIEQFIFDKEEGKKQIIFSHHNLFKGKTSFFSEKAISYEQLSENCHADYIFNGHIHYPPNGDYVVKIGDTTFVNTGSFSRGSLSQDNIDRPVQIAFLDTDKEDGLQLIDIKAKPAEEVFDLIKKSDEDEKNQKIGEFVQYLRDSVDEVEGDDIMTILNDLDIDSSIREKVDHYLSLAGE